MNRLAGKTAIHAAAAHFGSLGVLVNNAGISGSPKLTDHVTEAKWDHVRAVNVKGVFFGTKHAIPHLRAAGKGAIIHLSSIAGLIGIGGIAPLGRTGDGVVKAKFVTGDEIVIAGGYTAR